MKEQIIYRKVFIRGEEDLPSKEARYFVGHKMGGQLADWFIPEHEIGNKYWLDNYGWYLLPVPLPTDKEIKQWIKKDRQSLIDCEVATSGELMERFHGREEGVAWLKSRLTSK